MTRPSIASVTIGSNTFEAVGIHFGIAAMRDGMSGMPQIGSMSCSIAVVVNLNDQNNLPFVTLNNLFQLACGITREKVQDIKLTFWADDAKRDVICSYIFRGWISNYVTATGSSQTAESTDLTNHLLTLTFEPELDAKQFVKIQLGN